MESRPEHPLRPADAVFVGASVIIGDASSRPKAGTAAHAVARLMAGYLILTVPLLAFGGYSPLKLPLLGIHLVVAVGLLAIRAHDSPPRGLSRLADWAPLLLVPVLYAELPVLMDALPGPVRYHDPAVAGLESRLFGGQPAFAWAAVWPVPLLSELLHACYLSYYALIFMPPLLLYTGLDRTRADAFHATVLALSLSFLVCFAVFVVYPVQGPRYLGVPSWVADGPVRTLVLAVLEGGSSRGAAFPSSHVAVAVTQTTLALRYQPRLGVWLCALTLGLAAGAVYGGFHYAVDVIAGAAVGVLVVPIAQRLGSGVERA